MMKQRDIMIFRTQKHTTGRLGLYQDRQHRHPTLRNQTKTREQTDNSTTNKNTKQIHTYVHQIIDIVYIGLCKTIATGFVQVCHTLSSHMSHMFRAGSAHFTSVAYRYHWFLRTAAFSFICFGTWSMRVQRVHRQIKSPWVRNAMGIKFMVCISFRSITNHSCTP